MDAYSARIHFPHRVASAASVAHALSERCRDTRQLCLEVFSVDRCHRHVANEKCNVLATSTIPQHVKRIHELIADAREMLADSRA